MIRGMTERAPEHPNAPEPNTAEPNGDHWLRRLRTGALSAVVALPPALNAENIVGWANTPDGLGLPIVWAWIAFGGLDLIAFVCVLETLIQSQRGRKAGAFALLVWAFAGASAYAGYRHGTLPGSGRDVKWFFPFMALAGPLLLHLILKRNRVDKQVDEGKRLQYAPASAYGWKRWLPVTGAFMETYCAWRLGHLEGITKPAVAVDRYRALRPYAGRTGLRVLRALRADAERRRANAAAPIRTPAPRTPDEANTDQVAKANGSPNGRVRTRHVRKSANTGPNGSAEERYLKAREHFAGHAERPSVRELAVFLGVAPTTAHPWHKRLMTDLGGSDDKEEAQSA